MTEAARAAPVEDGGRFASPLVARLLAGALVIVGSALRWWVVRSRLGLVDGDEAVVGLMARRALHGSFTTFFWGQEYGGSQEALLVALLLALRVPGRWAMEVVPIALHAGGALLVWRIGLRTLERRGAAALAGAICWAGSPALLWSSTKERGFYGFTLVCGLAAFLLVLRLARCARWPEAVALGLALGLGWWASPHILHFAVPGLAWLAWTMRRRLGDLFRTLAVATPAAVVGALPWLWANAGTHLASFHAAADRRRFGDPLPIFFRYGVPMVLGLKRPMTLGWEFTGARVLYGLVLLGVVVLLVLRPRRLRPVLLVVAAYPLLFAVLPTTYYYGEPRYLDHLWPFLALLGGYGLARLGWPLRVLAVAGFVAVTTLGVAHLTRLQGPPGEPFEDVSPTGVRSLVLALDALDADRVFADYWVAYRLTWETQGRIVATPLAPVRDPHDDAVVRRAPAPVFVAAARCHGKLQAAMDARGLAYEVTPVERVWEVVVPDRPVLPDELAGSPLC